MRNKIAHNSKLHFLLLMCAFISTGCSNVQEVINNKTPEYGKEVAILPSVTYDYDHAIFDDFKNGVDFSRWIIGSGAWGEKNGGVIPENVFYTEDGILLLRGNGSYYAKEEIKGVGNLKDGRKTGACLVSKFTSGPGRYEVRMKPLPRKGACTAFWTYNNVIAQPANYNHEIDIELPGGKAHSDISFRYVLNTNYTYETLFQSEDILVKDALSDKVVNLNDGNFHNFGFEWYTNPKMVVYFLDGIVTNVSTGDDFVPTLETRVWFGNWFPDAAGFVGEAEFETDYMQVDWFKYIPFDESQTYDRMEVAVTVNSALEIQYPSSPISMPTVDTIANGDFEYVNKKATYENFGWDFKRLPGETRPISEVAYVSKNQSFDSSACAILENGGMMEANIDSVYEGFKYNLNLDYVTTDTDSVMEIRYYNNTDTIIKSDFHNLTSTTWDKLNLNLVMPKNTNSIIFRFYNTNKQSTLKIDNVKMERIYGEY